MAPPRGIASTLVMPLTRATGISSLSGLIATSARMFGLMSPVSASRWSRPRCDLGQAEHAVRGEEAGIDVLAGHGHHPGARGRRRRRRRRR